MEKNIPTFGYRYPSRNNTSKTQSLTERNRRRPWILNTGSNLHRPFTTHCNFCECELHRQCRARFEPRTCLHLRKVGGVTSVINVVSYHETVQIDDEKPVPHFIKSSIFQVGQWRRTEDVHCRETRYLSIAKGLAIVRPRNHFKSTNLLQLSAVVVARLHFWTSRIYGRMHTVPIFTHYLSTGAKDPGALYSRRYATS